MRVIVAGATGFIGSHLVRALRARGDTVVALSRSVASASRSLGPDVDVLAWNPPQPGPWMEALNTADVVVNLAGETVASPIKPWTEAERARIRSSRVDATSAIVEAFRRSEQRPPVLINASAIGYYGSHGDELLTEASPPGTDFLASLVRDWEAAACQLEPLGVRLVLPRTGIVLGTDGGALPQFVLPFRFFAGGTMGNPKQWISWIHIDDEIGLFLFAMDTPQAQGPINFTAPTPVTMDRFSREIGAALGRPSWIPGIGLAMRLGLGKRAEAFLASQRVLPAEAERLGYRFQHVDSDEALRSLLAPH